MIALLYGEPGERHVRALLDRSCISAVNVSEVVAKLIRDGDSEQAARSAIGVLDLDIVPFDAESAYTASGLIAAAGSRGLSLGDRACLALARKLKMPAVTAGARWTKIRTLGVKIHLIR